MTVLRPFKALRPTAEAAAKVAAVPYDVISINEAKKLAAGNPLSFLHVTRSEIDLPDQTDPYADEVYTRAQQNFRAITTQPDSSLSNCEHFIREAEPCLYLYRLTMDGRDQTGICGCFSIDEYNDGKIKIHEKTRPDKEDDRTRHILALGAHAEPVILAYREDEKITEHWETAVKESDPLYDFTADDGIRHMIWRLPNPEWYIEAFKPIRATYIADGHHRVKSASRAREELRRGPTQVSGEKEQDYFLAVLFPHTQLKILPYNRLIKRIPNGPVAFLRKLGELFEVTSGSPTPERKGLFSMYFGGHWLTVSPKQGVERRSSVVDTLDTSILQNRLLGPLLGIDDPRTSKNIEFIGGIRGTAALEAAVECGRAECAFSLFPLSMDELFQTSDAGLTLPPKSTWFEPKLRSGLLVHNFSQ